MKTSKRYVVFFTEDAKISGSPKRKKQLTVRTAKGPVDAYRKATGWKGLVGSGKGYSPQTPARQVSGYYKRPETDPSSTASMDEWLQLYKDNPPPPSAYVVPLGEW